jgi:hypothetical protein
MIAIDKPHPPLFRGLQSNAAVLRVSAFRPLDLGQI